MKKILFALLLTGLTCTAQAQPDIPPDTEEPVTPGNKYRRHDEKRPQPTAVKPGENGAPPADAVVLFDGKDLSQWRREAWKDDPDKSEAPRWKVENGYCEVVPRSGVLWTKQKFGDCQIHLEWATPAAVKGNGQARGNSGLFLPGVGELQILDSFENVTYPDGQAGAFYGKYPPRVNAARQPGAWQSYDVILEMARMEKGQITRPATVTVLHNGVLIHHALPLGNFHGTGPLGLQDHLNPLRFRNIWVRPLKDYDAANTPETK